MPLNAKSLGGGEGELSIIMKTMALGSLAVNNQYLVLEKGKICKKAVKEGSTSRFVWQLYIHIKFSLFFFPLLFSWLIFLGGSNCFIS